VPKSKNRRVSAFFKLALQLGAPKEEIGESDSLPFFLPGCLCDQLANSTTAENFTTYGPVNFQLSIHLFPNDFICMTITRNI